MRRTYDTVDPAMALVERKGPDRTSEHTDLNLGSEHTDLNLDSERKDLGRGSERKDLNPGS